MSKTFLITAITASLIGFLAGRYMVTSDDLVVKPEHSHGEQLAVISAQVDESYTCPMHAEIVSREPGSCPICGMDLVRNQLQPQSDRNRDDFPAVRIPPTVVHNLGVRTARVETGELRRKIETIGKITRVDPTARRILTPPIGGELVYVADKRDGDLVHEGELLFSVSSQELIEFEKAFQEASRSGDRTTATAMIPQLRKMGLTPEQIARLQADEEPNLPVEVRAFEDGFIFERRGDAGESVHTGFTVFNVGGNYRVIEVTAEIFERQWGWAEEGQSATMTVRGLPGVIFEGTVVRVEPPVGYTTRSLEVALKFKTEHPGISQSMFAHVSILGQSRANVLMVPINTVIRTGEGERVVRVLGDGRYQPTPVIAGEESDGIVEILSGLKEGDTVVASGQFLIDSESNLLAGFRRMYTPGVKEDVQAQREDAQRHHQNENHQSEHVEEGVDARPQHQRLNSYRQMKHLTDSKS